MLSGIVFVVYRVWYILNFHFAIVAQQVTLLNQSSTPTLDCPIPSPRTRWFIHAFAVTQIISRPFVRTLRTLASHHRTHLPRPLYPHNQSDSTHFRGPPCKGIDVGTGASCIYPLLGAKVAGWSFLATETDVISAEWAGMNVRANDLQVGVLFLPY